MSITILDGAMGGELQRKEIIPRKAMWTGYALRDHPEAIAEIHRQYIDAGAEIITCANYATVPRLMADEGLADQYEEYARQSVRIAKQAREDSGKKVLIAGSLPPLDQSYRPDLAPDEPEMSETYDHLASALVDEGADMLIAETMSSIRESIAASRAGVATGKPTWLAWSLSDAADGTLRSGESLEAAYQAVKEIPIAAFLFNCCSVESIDFALPILHRLTDRPIGVYANNFKEVPKDFVIGDTGPIERRDDLHPPQYSARAKIWINMGASIIGGCCGTGPEHIHHLAEDHHQ